MSTTARKQRKRTRRAALELGYTGIADAYRYQHPRKTPTRTHDAGRYTDTAPTQRRAAGPSRGHASAWNLLLRLAGGR